MFGTNMREGKYANGFSPFLNTIYFYVNTNNYVMWSSKLLKFFDQKF